MNFIFIYLDLLTEIFIFYIKYLINILANINLYVLKYILTFPLHPQSLSRLIIYLTSKLNFNNFYLKKFFINCFL